MDVAETASLVSMHNGIRKMFAIRIISFLCLQQRGYLVYFYVLLEQDSLKQDMGKYVEVAEKPKNKRKKRQSGKAQSKGGKQEHASKRKKAEKATANDSLNKKENEVTKIYFF